MFLHIKNHHYIVKVVSFCLFLIFRSSLSDLLKHEYTSILKIKIKAQVIIGLGQQGIHNNPVPGKLVRASERHDVDDRLEGRLKIPRLDLQGIHTDLVPGELVRA